MSEPRKKMPGATTPSFEEALKALESLITSMEKGDTPLADLVTSYEKGSALLKTCEKHLKTAELKLLHLKENAHEPEPFSLDSQA